MLSLLSLFIWSSTKFTANNETVNKLNMANPFYQESLPKWKQTFCIHCLIFPHINPVYIRDANWKQSAQCFSVQADEKSTLMLSFILLSPGFITHSAAAGARISGGCPTIRLLRGQRMHWESHWNNVGYHALHACDPDPSYSVRALRGSHCPLLIPPKGQRRCLASLLMRWAGSGVDSDTWRNRENQISDSDCLQTPPSKTDS